MRQIEERKDEKMKDEDDDDDDEYEWADILVSLAASWVLLWLKHTPASIYLLSDFSPQLRFI